MMPPRVRKLALVVHIVCSVGWIGAIAASLTLAIVGLVSTDGQLVQGIYLVLQALGWTVLVPFSLLSLATGIIQALGTRWGLFRHYWVVIKLVMNLFASTILLLYMQTLTALADAARAAGGGDASTMADPSPAVHSGAAIALLTVAAVLSVYKPAGQTAYGMRHNRISSTAAKAGAAP
jgi:hypothetical protein